MAGCEPKRQQFNWTRARGLVADGVMMGKTDEAIARLLGSRGRSAVLRHLERFFRSAGLHGRAEVWHLWVSRTVLARIGDRGEMAPAVAIALELLDTVSELARGLDSGARDELRREIEAITQEDAEARYPAQVERLLALRERWQDLRKEDAPYCEEALVIVELLICHLCAAGRVPATWWGGLGAWAELGPAARSSSRHGDTTAVSDSVAGGRGPGCPTSDRR